MTEDDQAKDFANWIDSNIYLDILKEAGELLDNQKIPLIGRYWYNPETDEVEPL